MSTPLRSLLVLTALLALPAQAVLAFQNPHVGHVADGFSGTPDGMGLLPTAIAEAETAARHAGLAARDLESLEGMKTHIGHVLHAIDPSRVDGGPGAGYGVIEAANGVARHIELAAQLDGATQAVARHAPHVAQAARNTAARAERIAELAAQVQAASSAADAAPLVTEIQTLAEQLIDGADADGNGSIGWQEGEGGLAVAEQHVGFMRGG